MWFDPQKALAAIEGGDMPPSDPAPDLAQDRLARLAGLARPLPQNPKFAPEAAKPADLARPAPEPFAQGKRINGDPRTWTGRVVSLADWRRLSEWERHGPNGRWFYGDARQWEKPRGST
ncbi:MAG: hypothetical protein H6897_14390 [Rhodobacteraceae bacterium]|nr:hypothetical protein [Paracoccaceae bacterium]